MPKHRTGRYFVYWLRPIPNWPGQFDVEISSFHRLSEADEGAAAIRLTYGKKTKISIYSGALVRTFPLPSD